MRAGRMTTDARELDALMLVAHELRASLTVLNGYLSMLPDVPPATQQSFTDTMCVVVAEMEKLVGLLVAASHVRAGTITHSPRPLGVMEPLAID